MRWHYDWFSETLFVAIFVVGSPIIVPIVIVVGPFVLLYRYFRARKEEREDAAFWAEFHAREQTADREAALKAFRGR
jgi:hypothetical protein